MNDPIMVCGAPGSGTSLVTKILRYSGVFVGHDAGPMDARKFHESVSFQDANNLLLNATIAFPHAPKGVEQFQTHVKKLEQQPEHFASMIDLEQLLRTYWGDQEQTQRWGWKDPRNSANAIVWRNLFPNLRLLTIKKAWKRQQKNLLGTLAGTWFRSESNSKIRDLYIHPPGTDGLDIHQLDLDRLLVDELELPRLWSWLGVPASTLPHAEFMEMVGVEKPG